MTAVTPPGFQTSWENRLRDGAYTSPGGTRLEYEYEDVGREWDKRGSVFEFGGIDGTYVQQTGNTGRRYPMRIFFSGRNHDRLATLFEVALLEEGIGKLEHPLYGTVDVVPFGTITRRDDLKTAANQTVFEVTFFTTVGAVYPQSGTHPESEILTALDAINVASAEDFTNGTDLRGALNQSTGKATVRNAVKQAGAALGPVAAETAEVSRGFIDLKTEIDVGLPVLIEDPRGLALKLNELVQLPGQAATAIVAKLQAFADFALGIFTSSAGKPEVALAPGSSIPVRRARIANDFRIADLFATAAVAGSVQAVISHRFETKPQALAAAEEVIRQFDAVVVWRDAGFGALADAGAIDQLDTGGAYQALQHAVALAAGFLIQISFTLVPERRIVLDRARTIIDLAAELYGSVDDRLDFLISSNELTGDETLELPAGKVIKYYARTAA